jgi:peptidoglycan/LPS O-acetylase OafA/YrhL
LFARNTLTLGEQYASAGSRPTGFDYLRITLAVSLVLFHAILVCYEPAWAQSVLRTGWRLPLLLLVPSFFSLSGFLIAGSLERSTVPVFIGLRILRIIPALTVDTLLTAFVIGVLFTAVPLREYFGSVVTWKYLLNIIGQIHYRLPGLFLNNPIPQIVNAQLWTIPWEFVCYAIIVFLAIIGIAQSRLRFLIVAIIAPIVVLGAWATLNPTRFSPSAVIIAPLPVDVVLCFLLGVAVYKFRDMIPYSVTMAALSVIVYVTLMYTRYSSIFTCIPVSYLTVWIGVTNYPRNFLIRGGDYSYGIYLYHFTFQQAIVAMGVRAWYMSFILSLMAVTAIAAMSWHWIEKPALSLRVYLTGTGDKAQYFAKLMRAGDPRRIRLKGGESSASSTPPRE